MHFLRAERGRECRPGVAATPHFGVPAQAVAKPAKKFESDIKLSLEGNSRGQIGAAQIACLFGLLRKGDVHAVRFDTKFPQVMNGLALGAGRQVKDSLPAQLFQRQHVRTCFLRKKSALQLFRKSSIRPGEGLFPAMTHHSNI